jgi:hypothetical protein
MALQSHIEGAIGNGSGFASAIGEVSVQQCRT